MAGIIWLLTLGAFGIEFAGRGGRPAPKPCIAQRWRIDRLSSSLGIVSLTRWSRGGRMLRRQRWRRNRVPTCLAKLEEL
ncbi:BgtTE-56012 [Blumeria graminis f. sp. tritici]|uniref:BgtTE-56012 n=1 Tax=Blumeria graminis f. sp. tritici TaxID=62690 RepID=A0A9X9L8M9_BLUGR|nr:BgtTE-56012 [Blumeria graminis f. sp. tritici]